MTLICDAGAFLALERGDPVMVRRFKAQLATGTAPVTHGGVVAQVWRGGRGRQALLARALAVVDVEALDDRLGRRAGLLLSEVRTSDAIDAAVVALAADGDQIVTSDPDDLQWLIEVTGQQIAVIPV